MENALRILVLPGWLNSGASHWQSRWEIVHADAGCERVEQDDWNWPRRGDWMARLDEMLLQPHERGKPALLVAHSLGCQLVAAWAAHSKHSELVRGALLVAPPDTEREDTPPNLFNWRPIVRAGLPFPSTLVYSCDDPFCSSDRALAMAQDWGSNVLAAGPRGHLNGDSGLGDWPEGWALLEALAHDR